MSENKKVFDWTPTMNVVVVEVEKAEEKTVGGIIVPADSREREQYGKDSGVVVSYGESAFKYDNGDYWDNKPDVGDLVMFDKYDGKTRDKGQYRLLVDSDILAIKKMEK